MIGKVLRIGELHYHFRRCGVRTVIENLLRGLIAYSSFEQVEFDLISCDARQELGRELVNSLLLQEKACPRKRGHGTRPVEADINSLQVSAGFQGKEVVINPIELPELDYQMEPAVNRKQLFAESTDIANRILVSLRLEQHTKENPYVLHVHNSNLGKNPRLTLALKLLADRLEEENLPAWILYQMHDFAEDHRPANWAALCNCSGKYDRQLAVEMMYPTSSRVLWVCINSADQEKLISIGLNPDTVSLLPNSVDVATFSSPALMSMTDAELDKLQIPRRDFASDLKERIGTFARNNGFTFDPQRKILLAPIKTLRRKNVIESVLLLSALNVQDDRYQLLVTLPGASPADVEYCQAIEEFVKRNQNPVVIGFGEELLAGGNQRVLESGELLRYGLIDLLYISEAVVTTSIQEGFGYVFHEPWLAGKAVLGRNIPNVTRDFCAAGMQLNHFYDHLLIPWSLISDIWPKVVEAYQRKVNELRKSAALTLVSDETLTNQINRDKTYKLHNRTDVEEKYIDWADLPWRMQLLVLQEFSDDVRIFPKILWVNDQLEPLRDWYPSDISDIIIQNQRIVQSHYGLAKVIETFSGLMAEGKKRISSKRENRHSRLSNDGVFALSLEPQHLRLLA